MHRLIQKPKRPPVGKTARASPQPLGARDDYKLSNRNELFIRIESLRADMNTLQPSNLIYARNKRLNEGPGAHVCFIPTEKYLLYLSLPLIT